MRVDIGWIHGSCLTIIACVIIDFIECTHVLELAYPAQWFHLRRPKIGRPHFQRSFAFAFSVPYGLKRGDATDSLEPKNKRKFVTDDV